MAFNKYVSGAWIEPESAVKRYTGGAWQECESAKRYVDGAWQEVWANQKPLSIVEFDDDYSTLSLSDNETQLKWVTEANDAKTLRVCTVADTYSNAVITFSYYGGRTYFKNDSAQGGSAQAGTLKIIGVINGSVTTLKSITLGSSSGETSDYLEDFTLNGTFSQIGFEVTTNSMSTIYDVYTEINIYDVIIDGKEYTFKI